MPFHDQCLSMTADVESPTGWAPGREGILRPGADPNKYMNIGKIDVSTGELKLIWSQPQPTNGSALTTAGGDCMFAVEQGGQFLWSCGLPPASHG